MRLEHVVSLAVTQLIGRLIRRLIAMAVLALVVLAAVYHLTVAGTLELEKLFGLVNARLIVTAVYVVIALIIFGVLFATRAKPANAPKRKPGIAQAPPDARIAMLIESLMLGYSLARGKSRSSKAS
jgi:type VI protein secretion system component VasK